MTTELRPARLHAGDVLRTATVGLRARRVRSVLSAVGIAIGIASMVAVLGLSESSKSELLSALDRLGTNLLTVQAGGGIGLGSGTLPEEATSMVGRIGPVERSASVSAVPANVYLTDLIPAERTNTLTVQAVEPTLLDTLSGVVAAGRWLDDSAIDYPVAVLGSVAAERLGVGRPGGLVWIGDTWFGVVGILEPFELSPDLDRAALVSYQAADRYLDHDGIPTTIHVRTDPLFVEEVMGVLAATANPENPEEVEVSRPTDALEAREAAESAFTSLFLGLGAVALLVGGVGIANVMVISVLERRAEIGLRRALGATRRHIALQFIGEALVLSGIGGISGVALGYLVTAGWAVSRGWQVIVPPVALIGGLAAAVGIGAVAGLYPALRAARLSPTDALRSA